MTNYVTRHLVRGMFLSAFVSGAVACGTEEVSIEPLELPEGCQPLLAGLECGLPFPSDHFLVDDPTMPNGKRIAMQASAILPTIKANRRRLPVA